GGGWRPRGRRRRRRRRTPCARGWRPAGPPGAGGRWRWRRPRGSSAGAAWRRRGGGGGGPRRGRRRGGDRRRFAASRPPSSAGRRRSRGSPGEPSTPRSWARLLALLEPLRHEVVAHGDEEVVDGAVQDRLEVVAR